MKFRVLKEKITPDIPVMQCGFASRDHKSIGIHDDIYASVVFINSNETVIIISLDLCYGDRSFAFGIKKAIMKKYGLSQDKIIISYSHTHSAVAVTGEDIDKRLSRTYSMTDDNPSYAKDSDEVDYTEDVRYFSLIRNKIMDMVDEAFANPIEGDAYFCKGYSKFGVSRRYPSENGALWKPCFDENRMDPDLFLIKFVDKDNTIHGLVYSYACHPTTLNSDNYLISADYPGAVGRILEERNPGMTAVFLQGCGADIKPTMTAGNGKFKNCTFEELEQGGKSFADEIQEYIGKPVWREISTDIKTGCSEIRLYTETWDIDKWQSIIDSPEQPKYRKDSAERIISLIKENRVNNFLPYYISFLRLEAGICLVCLECEVVSDIGKKIKKLFNEDVIVLGYANSVCCYIPTRQVLQEGGYERESFIYARLAGPFVPEVEDTIIGRAASLVKYGE